MCLENKCLDSPCEILKTGSYKGNWQLKQHLENTVVINIISTELDIQLVKFVYSPNKTNENKRQTNSFRQFWWKNRYSRNIRESETVIDRGSVKTIGSHHFLVVWDKLKNSVPKTIQKRKCIFKLGVILKIEWNIVHSLTLLSISFTDEYNQSLVPKK